MEEEARRRAAVACSSPTHVRRRSRPGRGTRRRAAVASSAPTDGHHWWAAPCGGCGGQLVGSLDGCAPTGGRQWCLVRCVGEVGETGKGGAPWQKGSYDAEKKTVTLQRELVGNVSRIWMRMDPDRFAKEGIGVSCGG
ncbi:uncharacterized protein LOC124659632 [Lolium rigidum]|uniref:uncharacterized protein LOC124659632 n=1 Tax=Lolium rigidum TaxID=89674 RepID=UPI001F5D1645|nr:uncharacterized protein LOC124659632 [Lolium rigidum]